MLRQAFALSLTGIVIGAATSAGSSWHDTFYQYRIPIVIDTDSDGWHIVPVDEQRIIEAINRLEELRYDTRWFAYNHVKLVPVDAAGQETGGELDGGFYMCNDGSDLAEGTMEKPRQKDSRGAERVRPEAELEAGAMYLLDYTSANAGSSPMKGYDRIFPPGTAPRLRRHDYYTSYEPPLLPKARARHQRLFIPDGYPLDLHIGGTWSADIDELSLHKVQMKLLVNLPTGGRNHFMLYYQPLTGHHLTVPQRRVESMPERRARLYNMAPTEKYYGSTRYALAATEQADIWFAETTVKLTPHTPVPAGRRERVEISLAGGEAQTFQLIISPHKTVGFESINVDAPANSAGRLPDAEVYVLDYVPITKNSFITPIKYIGAIGDPLVEVESRELAPMDGNLALCVTVNAGRDAAPGQYDGTLRIRLDGEDVNIPLTVHVHDFVLPEYSLFKSNVGAQYLAKPGEPGENPPLTLDFHGLSRNVAESAEDLKKLAREYYRVMTRNRFHPKTVALYSEIGLKWEAPPEGFNVDAPDNYFRLYDWDFTEFNKTLSYFIDELKVNQITLMHINPTRSNIFFHLPGERLEHYPKSSPFVTMAWQTFREMTYVAYGKREGDPYYDVTIEITRDQFDRLLLDFFREIAENLQEHGWLDKAYVMIDESMDQQKLHHFISVLKSDPLVAQIKVGACMQGHEVFTHKLPESDEYAFNGLMDYYIPQMDENYNRWEKHMFPDYGIEPDREKLWNYAVYSARLSIDTPGINHRQLALDLFNRGASGYLIWEVFGWYNWYEADRNPWVEPYSRIGNGMFSFFYPPRRDGSMPDEPDFKITPSLRVLIHRQAAQDYDYAWMLENLINQGHERGLDVSGEEVVLNDIGLFFDNMVHWSQNDAWYLELRERMAGAIVKLKGSLAEKS